MYSVENTWKEIRDSGVDTAIVAFGSIEQHGHHLPLGTDWLIAQARAKALAEKLNAFLLPAMPFGNSREHMAFPGTISLRPLTLAAVLEDIVESLRHHGIRKIVVMSCHGGNWVLKPTLRELNFKYADISIVWADGVVPERGDKPPVETHAGRGETSIIQHLRPDLVKDGFGQGDSPGVVGQEFNDYVGYEKTTRTGAWGLPSQASAEAGAQGMETALQRQVEYIRYAFVKVAELKKAPGANDE
ncbi:MAG: creatininase family protein [Planctomycetes bacterium]|nr:creatininase family protein [Planctomycetota bacterium]